MAVYLNGFMIDTTILDIIGELGYYIEVCDEHGVYVYVSKKGFDTFLVSPESAVGKKVTDVYSLNRNETDPNQSILLRTMKLGRPLKKSFWQYGADNGKKFYWIIDSIPIVAGNKMIGAMCIGQSFRSVKAAVERIENQMTPDFNHIASQIINVKNTFDKIVYQSDVMQDAITYAKRIATSPSSVLLIGESGVGKELFAGSIHSESSRSQYPFVAVNCSAIPDTLLESTLFGTVKGAYTGAVDKKGLFEEAGAGTIFLDEINSISTDLQAKLLRVLAEKTVRRVGSNHETKVLARVISAVNEDPLKLLNSGKMRADLFYRLTVASVEIPPLRDRNGDVLLLANYFLKKNASLYHKNINRLSHNVAEIFQKYLWPGNVRELRHTIEHAVNVCGIDDEVLEVKHLPYFFLRQTGEMSRLEAREKFKDINYKEERAKYLEKCEHEFVCSTVKRALNNFEGNISKTAEHLHISRQYLHNLIKEHDIE